MPVYPIRWQPLARTGRYTHMARRDGAVWERFLDRAPTEYDAVAYDVALGGVRPQMPGVSEPEARAFQYSTALKIDALLRRASSYTIVEVKPEANVSAIGAVLAYAVLLEKEDPTVKAPALLIVAEFASRDILECAAALGVAVRTV